MEPRFYTNKFLDSLGSLGVSDRDMAWGVIAAFTKYLSDDEVKAFAVSNGYMDEEDFSDEDLLREAFKAGFKAAQSLRESDGIKKPLEKDLSKVENSMTKVLSDNIEKYNSATTKDAVYALTKSLFAENNIDTPASNRLLTNIAKSKSYFKALETVTNSMLYGSKLGILEEDK